MTPIPFIAMTTEELGHSHSVMNALPHLGGMLMVLVTLAILWGLTALVSKAVAFLPNNKQAAPTTKTPAAASTTSAPAPGQEGVPPEIIAVISAAVAAIAGPNRRVISIQPMSTSWERAGRQSVLTSHRIR